MIVTVDYLLEACSDQVALFEATFGESVEVTRESLTRANGAGLSLDWFGRNAFGNAYREGVASAWKAYQEAEDLALKAYEKARAPAWKAYEEEIVSAKKARSKAYDKAWKAYTETTASAFKVFQEACALARKTYHEALVEVIFNLSQVTSTP